VSVFPASTREAGRLLRDAGAAWLEDDVPQLAAALAYYTAFSLAPLLVIAIAAAGLVFGAEAAQGRIVGQLSGLVGREGGEAIEAMIASARQPRTGVLAGLIGAATLLLGATGVFGQLRAGLNRIWEVPSRGFAWKSIVTERLAAFAMVLAIGFLLLVSLLLSAFLSALAEFARPRETLLPLVQALNFVLGLGLVVALFALIYRFVPDARIPWRHVLSGALVAGLLFSVGKWAIGAYLGHSTVTSAFGAAGSLVVLLIWVYYSAQILLFGAEIAHVGARRVLGRGERA
jgi:membrane protein